MNFNKTNYIIKGGEDINIVIREGYELFKDDFCLNNGNIDWKKSINKTVRIMYDFNVYYIKIVGYNKNLVTVEFEDEKFNIYSSNIKKCSIGKIIGKVTKDFKIGIGSIFDDSNRSLIITDRVYKERKYSNTGDIINEKWYKYKCNKCGWDEGWMIESGLNRGNGCACCANQIAVLGINTIWDTAKWMCDLGVLEEDAKKYTRCSNKKIGVVCPDCKEGKIIGIANIYNRKSIGCSCGDGVSYPEKFMNSILRQLDVEFLTQYSPEYLKREENGKMSQKRSDFYIPKLKLVIEVDGGMNHKGGKIHSKSNKTLDEFIEIDNWKDEQYKFNAIKTIRIDCGKSNMEYIKNSILESKLNNIFDLSQVDWLKCEEFAIKSNKVKEVCDYWNNKEEWETTTTIAKNNKLGMKNSPSTIISYLKKGTKLGWCNYDPKEEMRKSGSKASLKNFKYVKC